MTEIILKLNNCGSGATCPICHKDHEVNVGWEPFLAEGSDVVCRACFNAWQATLVDYEPIQL